MPGRNSNLNNLEVVEYPVGFVRITRLSIFPFLRNGFLTNTKYKINNFKKPVVRNNYFCWL